MTFAEILAEKGAEAGLSFTPLQLEQFSRYYELLVETNKLEVFGDIATWLDKQLTKQ